MESLRDIARDLRRAGFIPPPSAAARTWTWTYCVLWPTRAFEATGGVLGGADADGNSPSYVLVGEQAVVSFDLEGGWGRDIVGQGR